LYQWETGNNGIKTDKKIKGGKQYILISYGSIYWHKLAYRRLQISGSKRKIMEYGLDHTHVKQLHMEKKWNIEK